MIAAGESAAAGEEAELNGFSLRGLIVAPGKILAGGPARDAIASVDDPAFVAPRKAKWVRFDTPVIGVEVDGEARCYPVHVMEYHQVVNDRIAGVPLLVSYDPLTDTAIAYRRRVDRRELTFGVSGLIFRSNFLLYDRQSESLWSQFQGRALAGRLAGQTLERVRTRTEPMAVWLGRHPKTVVMTLPDRRRYDYRYSRYSSYWVSDEIPFPVEETDSRHHPKELVLGVTIGDRSRVYIASILGRAGTRIVDEFAGRRIRVSYDGETGTFGYEAPEDVEVTTAYWFAWKAFHPDTEIWQGRLPIGSHGETGQPR